MLVDVEMYKLIKNYETYIEVEIHTRVANGKIEQKIYLIDSSIEAQRSANSITLLHDLVEVNKDPSKRGSGTIFADTFKASSTSSPVGRVLHGLNKGHKRNPYAEHNDLRRSAREL